MLVHPPMHYFTAACCPRTQLPGLMGPGCRLQYARLLQLTGLLLWGRNPCLALNAGLEGWRIPGSCCGSSS